MARYSFSSDFYRMKMDFCGIFVFKWRGQIPVLFILTAAVVSYWLNFQIVDPQNSTWLFISTAIILVAAMSFRAYTIGFAAEHSSGRNRSEQVAEQLNVVGAYSMVQNPLYFSNSLLWTATALFSNQWMFLIASFLLILVLLPVIIQHERKFLQTRFGETFTNWCKNTPLIIPNPFLHVPPKSSFQWIRLLATEYPTWVSICVGVLLAHSFGNFLISSQLVFSQPQIILVITALTIGLTGRFFKYVVVRIWLKKPI